MRDLGMLRVLACVTLALGVGACAVAQEGTATPGATKAVCERCEKADCAYTVGINLAGAEFAGGQLPGVEGTHFKWPNEASLDYWQQQGVTLVRLPFKWERLQPTLKGEFDAQYEAGLVRSVRGMQARGMKIIPDVHNYAKYRGKNIGTEEVPMDAFADLWKRLAMLLKDEPGIWGYGLMNEPSGAKEAWQQAAQAAIDAIREVDQKTMILVANDYAGWSASYAKGDLADWIAGSLKIPDPKILKDPSNNLCFEMHFYLDHDNSGRYQHSYEHEIGRTDGPGARVSPTIGADRLRPYVEWLKRHNVKGFIGEYGGPANPEIDPRWLVVLENSMSAMRDACLPSTIWAAGDAWTPGTNYVAERRGWSRSLDEERRLRDRPQTLLMQRYMDPPRLSEDGAAALERYLRGEY